MYVTIKCLDSLLLFLPKIFIEFYSSLRRWLWKKFKNNSRVEAFRGPFLWTLRLCVWISAMYVLQIFWMSENWKTIVAMSKHCRHTHQGSWRGFRQPRSMFWSNYCSESIRQIFLFLKAGDKKLKFLWNIAIATGLILIFCLFKQCVDFKPRWRKLSNDKYS